MRAARARKEMRAKAEALRAQLPLHGWSVIDGDRQAQGKGKDDVVAPVDVLLDRKSVV